MTRDTQPRDPLRSPSRMARSATVAVLVGAALTILWMLYRLVATVALVVEQQLPNSRLTGYKKLDAVLPLFQLANGEVAVSDSTGYMGMWDGHFAIRASYLTGAAQLVSILSIAFVAFAVMLLCVRLLRGVPFTASGTRWVGAAGIILIVGGAVSQLLTWLARQAMLALVIPTARANSWRIPSASVPIDFVPLACGALLCIVALAFSAGTRLQKDTEGLV
jgi:hypothetical protein